VVAFPLPPFFETGVVNFVMCIATALWTYLGIWHARVKKKFMP
jgi:hypothetical protein